MARIKSLIIHFKDEYFRHTFYIYVFSLLSGAAGYFFQVLLGARLSRPDYGLFNSVLSGTVVAGAVIDIFRPWMTGYFSRLHRENVNVLPLAMKFMRYLAVLGLPLFLAVLFGASYLRMFFRTDLLLVPFVFLALILASTIPSPLYSLYESQRLFLEISASGFLGPALKLGITFLLFFYTCSLAPVFVIYTAAAYILPVILFFLLPRYFPGSGNTVLTAPPEFFNKNNLYSFLKILTGIIAFRVIFEIDMVMVRYFFSEDVSGDYAAVSRVGKILYFLASMSLPVFYSSSLHSLKEGRAGQKIFFKGLLIVSMVSLPAFAVLYTGAPFFLDLFLPNYRDSLPLMRIYLVLSLPYIYIQFMIHLLMVVGRWRIFAVSFAGVFLQIILIINFHGSLRSILYINASIGFFMFVCYTTYLLVKRKTLFCG